MITNLIGLIIGLGIASVVGTLLEAEIIRLRSLIDKTYVAYWQLARAHERYQLVYKENEDDDRLADLWNAIEDARKRIPAEDELDYVLRFELDLPRTPPHARKS